MYYREVTKRFELPPGTYVIIPATYTPHDEAEFMLRLFTEKQADSGVLDEDMTVPTGNHITVPTSNHILTPSAKDPIHEAFNRVAGSDTRIDSHELCVFLEDMSIIEFGEAIKFPLESCRSLLAIYDKGKSGYLNLSEVKKAWKEIKAYKELFKMFDADHSNTVDTRELGTLFMKIGFPVSKSVLAAIVRRYGGRDSRISLADFVLVICKLTALFESFQQQQHRQHRAGSASDMAEFTRNDFLQITMGL